MQVLAASRQAVQIELSLTELQLICNCLNEVCNGIDVPEFETRLGVTPEFADAFHAEVRGVIDATVSNQ